MLWQANSIQPIETRRLTYWEEINDLPKSGRISPEAQIGQGDASHQLLNIQPNGTLGPEPSGMISFLPYTHNVDSFGYRADAINEGIPYETESWGWLLDPKHRGRVAVVNAPSIGLFDLALAAPKEGYRAWYGVMCLSSAVDEERKEAAYAFMNWWLSGWPGAFIARQGYYISNARRTREYLSSEEWDFWYEGKPAASPMSGTDGSIVAEPGEVRRGGSYVKRFENIAVWNTVMDTYEYTLTKWKDLLLA